ncbi:MAG: protein phosphatase 2C domain-containing protein [Archangium sp.]|nr:protein phosphatase 2C domain-containing protein [Archangium sp.]
MSFESATRVEGQGTGCQDRVALIPCGSGVVAVVADGAGGTGGGGEAASTVLARVRTAVEEGRELNARGLRQLLLEIGVELEAAGAGQTTAVVIVAVPGSLVGVSVGDSGAWLIEPTGWRELTSGQPRKPLLGSGLAEPLTFTTDARFGAVLLATDGVLKYAAGDTLRDVVRREGVSVEACCEALIDAARLPNGKLQDDAGVVLLRLRPEARLVAALRAWLASGAGESEVQRSAAREFEQWLWLVAPFPGGTDGLTLSFKEGDGAGLTFTGSVWGMASQRAFPFHARLLLGTDQVQDYELSFGAEDTPEFRIVKTARPR